MSLSEHPTSSASTTQGLPISPALGPALHEANIKKHVQALDGRTLTIIGLSVGIAAACTWIAEILVSLIALITNISFFGKVSLQAVSPAKNSLGFWVIAVPVVGAFFVGLLARFGSKAIRGHGIPEAMEQILLNESRIPARLTFLKPLSAAVAIGTGGPFGAEGPIIATGGALGSLIGQLLHTTAAERKVLLAAGAAAGMTAIFGSPISAILLAIELLLFEFRPRSFIPVAFAAITAMTMRAFTLGTETMFKMPEVPMASSSALCFYVLEGLVIGVFSVAITKSIYLIEDYFEKLPIHWMWWPMIGALAVGLIGVVCPETLGVGYENIDRVLSGNFLGSALLFFCCLKFVSWSIALGSGTSGGTLAPIFTLGGSLGVLLGSGYISQFPGSSINLSLAALVGMAACFAGASRALFASVLFAFEITRQPNALVPLLGGCSAAYVVSAFIMKHTIMTEKLARRGHHVPTEYAAEHVGLSRMPRA
jgi:chloride channel protein, CIC family